MAKAKLELGRIKHDPLNTSEYYRQIYPKKQIYLHHTVSHPSPVNDINSWRRLGYRIGTCVVIAGKPYPNENYYVDGDIYQCFSSKYWALHLASHASGNRIPKKYKVREHTRFLEKHAIGIEICNAGWLTWENGKFYSSFRRAIPVDQVIEYVDKYRGQRFYQKYTDAQIETVRQLLVFFHERYNIPVDYQDDMWDISEKCLDGEPGVWTHTSVRTDKTDCHPQPELVQMLKNLKYDVKAEEPPAEKVEAEKIVVKGDKDKEEHVASPSLADGRIDHKEAEDKGLEAPAAPTDDEPKKLVADASEDQPEESDDEELNEIYERARKFMEDQAKREAQEKSDESALRSEDDTEKPGEASDEDTDDDDDDRLEGDSDSDGKLSRRERRRLRLRNKDKEKDDE